MGGPQSCAAVENALAVREKGGAARVTDFRARRGDPPRVGRDPRAIDWPASAGFREQSGSAGREQGDSLDICAL
jgi:hypothetical protein